MKLTFLEAEIPLTKRFYKTETGEIESEPYPLVKNLTSIVEEVTTPEDFCNALQKHAKLNHALLKGSLEKEIKSESRQGLTNRNEPTEFFCLDVDYLPNIETVDNFINQLPTAFQQASYVIQYSASYKLKKKGLAAHIFFLLAKPEYPQTLKQYTKWLNFEYFNSQITLNKIGTALVWPLDLTINDNTRIIYISPPALGEGIVDPVTDRFTYVKKDNDSLALDYSRAMALDLEARVTDKKNFLRQDKGLKPLKTGTRKVKDILIQSKPGSALITGIREQRGFVYFNLNGGDSWAYYHPIGNYEIIHNFKGEPNYLTKELLPDYYDQCTERLYSPPALDSSQDRVYLAFREIQTDQYYNGWYEPGPDVLTLFKTNSLTKINHFMKQNRQREPEYIPDWTYEFAFDNDDVIDFENQWANKFVRTKYIRNPVKCKNIPKKIDYVIRHALGNNDEAYEYFVNWLAFIYQRRQPTRTAWIMMGTQGTGKGALFHRIISPLFGSEYCVVKQLAQLEDQFNGYMENTVFLYIDESEISAVKNSQKLMAYVKNLIVEPSISVRHMHQQARMVKNNVNVIISSNKPDPMEIDPTDRRFNVGLYQPDKIDYTDEDNLIVEQELYKFAYFLENFEIDYGKMKMPLDNESRRQLMYITRNSIDEVASALLKGNLEFFIEQMPENNEIQGWQAHSMAESNYNKSLSNIIKRIDSDNRGKVGITSKELHHIFSYLVGNIPSAGIKFTKFLAHHGIYKTPIKIKTGSEWKSVRGIQVSWLYTDELLEIAKKAGD